MTEPAETSHRAEQELGPAIADGRVRWVSSTLLTGADPNSDGGCLRRTWFERVGGRDRETTAAMTAGVGMHAEIQDYLETGIDALGPVARAGLEFIPTPGAGLIVETAIINPTACVGGFGEALALMSVANDARAEGRLEDAERIARLAGVIIQLEGVPVAGHVDLYNLRGEYIDARGELRNDGYGALEVKDWKSTSNLKWAKNPQQVSNTIQMNIYATAGFALFRPNADAARLTHVYFQRNGRPQAKLATSLVPREKIDARWKYAGSLVRNLIDMARETDPNKVDANTGACHSYNRACNHLAYCEAGKAAQGHNAFADLFGGAAVDVLARMKNYQPADEGFDIMSVLDKVKTSTLAVVPTTTPADTSMLDDLLAEETAAQIANTPQITIPADFISAIGTISAKNSVLGFPGLEGEAAKLFALLNKHETIAESYPGTGTLAKLSLATAANVVQLAGEIRKKYPDVIVPATANQTATLPPTAAPAPVVALTVTPEPSAEVLPVIPPDAPKSNPVLAADPVEGLDTPKARELNAALAAKTPEIPGLAESAALAETGMRPIEPVTTEQPTEKPKRGRPVGSTNKKSKAPAEDSLTLIIDATADGFETQSLEPYVRNLVAEIAKATGVDGDIRAASEGPCAFAKWRGILATVAVKHPPAMGVYSADTRGNEFVEVVVVALRGLVESSGGLYIRGNR